MKELVNSRVFGVSFFLSYAAFFVITIFVYDNARDGFGVGHTLYGFPFGYYYSHCFGGYYLWTGLLGNVFVAAIVSSGIGLGFSHLWQKFSSEEFRSKWYL